MAIGLIAWRQAHPHATWRRAARATMARCDEFGHARAQPHID
jgi:hypothetical protein